MIQRTSYLEKIRKALARSRAVALLGPRQCGKTTLARQLVNSRSPNYFDLEDPANLAALAEPKQVLENLRGLVVIDEVQLRPELFPVLRVLLDRRPLPARFLILGSASPALLQQSSESLAGRLELVQMSGFSLQEIALAKGNALWLRGGFPRAFLARSGADSLAWRKNFIATILARDLSHQGITLPLMALQRFSAMLAHSNAHVWNSAPYAASLGISEPTVRKYLDIFSGVFMVRQLPPWHINTKKRQVKSPKIYLRDSGILHALLGIGSEAELLRHPGCGASWEAFVIEQIIQTHGLDEYYFWATHQGGEIDLVFPWRGSMYGIEIKRSDAPTLTPSMRIAIQDLQLARLAVIYPGANRYPLGRGIEAVPFSEVADGLRAIFSTK